MRVLTSFLLIISFFAYAEEETFKVEQYYYQKIETALMSYFSQRSDFILSVNAAVKEAPDQLSQLDMAYIVLPKVIKKGEVKTDLEVALKVKRKLEDSEKQDLENIIKFASQQLASKIDISSMDLALESRKPASEETSWDFEKIKPYLYLFLILASILIFYLSFRGLAASLSYAADGISNGLGQLKNIKIQSQPTDTESSSDKSVEVTKDPEITEQQIAKYLSNFETLAKNHPSVLFKIMGQHPDDYFGISWVMTQVDPQITTIIEKGLSFEKLNQALAEPKKIQQGLWLQQFVQRLYVERMKDKSLLNEILSLEERMLLFNSTKEDLIAFLKIQKNPAAWRLALECLSEKDVAVILSNASQEEWADLLKASHVKKDDLRKSFELFSSSHTKKESTHKTQEDLEFKIMNPILETISLKNYEEEQVLLSTIEVNNPDMAQKLKKLFWSFDKLLDITEADLKLILREAEVEEIVSLMIALPESLSSHIQNHLPDTNKKIIVLDLVQAGKQKADEVTMQSAFKVSREFLAKIRSQYQQGKIRFKVKNEDVSAA